MVYVDQTLKIGQNLTEDAGLQKSFCLGEAIVRSIETDSSVERALRCGEVKRIKVLTGNL